MRVIRSLFLLSVVAMAVAGCAAQPVAYMPMAAPNTLDSMTYGQAAAPGYAYPAASYQSGRGLYSGVAYTAPAPAYTAPVHVAPAPVYTAPAVAPTTSGGYYNSAVAPRVYPAAPIVAAPVVAAAEPAYTMDAGDRLRVTVFGQDGLTNAYVVGASGYIAMPLIGQVMARGLTTDQLSAHIAAKLKDGFIRDPHVAVEIEAYRPFFILGEVTQPGQYPYVANMTAETAVAIAGGFTPRAARQTVTLTRNYNGQQVRVAVPLTYELRPGDTVTIHERWF
jgi:polysaccharide biosynthesis/export protein